MFNTKAIVAGLKSTGKELVAATKQNSPTVLTGLAVVGLFSTVFLTAKIAPKAEKSILDEAKERGRELTKKEKAKKRVKFYWPVLVSLGLVSACMIGSNRISTKRIKVMTAAYTAAQSALEKRVEDTIEKMVDPETAEKVKEKLENDKKRTEEAVENVSDKDILETGGGEELFIDYESGQAFKASQGFILQAIELFNKDQIYTLENEWVTVNEVYDYLGLRHTGAGSRLGWFVNALDDGTNTRPGIEVWFDSKIRGGKAYTVMHFAVDPSEMGGY